MAASDNILGEKQYVPFQKILNPSEKPANATVYSFFEILSNEIFFKKNLFQTSCNLILRRVTK